MNEEKKYVLADMNEHELNLILNGLSQLPYVQVWQLIAKMQEQYKVQTEQIN